MWNSLFSAKECANEAKYSKKDAAFRYLQLHKCLQTKANSGTGAGIERLRVSDRNRINSEIAIKN